MVVIGLDPGENTGCALYEGAILARLWTLSPLDTIAYLRNFTNPDALFVMEDSRMQSSVFDRRTNARAKLKIARNIGQVDCLCGLYEQLIGEKRLIKLSPLQKGAKITDSEFFNKATGWEGSSNQHCRDAAMLGWRFRKLSVLGVRPDHLQTRVHAGS